MIPCRPSLVVFALVLSTFCQLALCPSSMAQTIAPPTGVAQTQTSLPELSQPATPSEPSPASTTQSTKPPPDSFHLGGAIRGNYTWKDYAPNSPADVELLRVDLNGQHGPAFFSVQYRWTRHHVDFVHHAYAGWHFSPDSDLRVGVLEVPFGLLPDASQSFWLNTGYFVGYEGDADLGAVWHRNFGSNQLHLGAFAGDEYTNGKRYQRFTPDLATTTQLPYREREHLSARYEHVTPWGDGNFKLGASVIAGHLQNVQIRDTHWQDAVAIHGQWQVSQMLYQLQWIRYRNAISNHHIAVSAYGEAYEIASQANVPSANVAYKLANPGWFDAITCYENVSAALPTRHAPDLRRTVQNVVGCTVNKGIMQTYVDVISGKNMVASGGDGVGISSLSPGWHTRLNINIGFYF